MATYGSLTDRVHTYIMKKGSNYTSILLSRETKFQEAYRAFQSHIFCGVGFGMPMNERDLDLSVVERDPILQLPLTAPVEASVIYMALPAQIGLIGLLPFLAFFFALAGPVARYAPLSILGISLCVLLCNFGEYAFFSFGGIGLFWWLVFGLSYAYSVRAGSET